ncbi:MAG: LysR family transcriptional regulator [Lachnospiraceae bacterium]|jgi:DNA-binding transcriptional LysR family regulator
MNTTQLEYYISTVNTGSLTKSAEKHFVTQPAISQQISKLESEVNAQLLRRESGKLILTESGEVLFNAANRIIDTLQAMKTVLRNISEGKIGRLKFFAVPSSIPEMCEYISGFKELFPDIQIEVDIGTGIEQLHSMNNRLHDLYFTFQTHAESQPNMQVYTTSSNRFALVIKKSLFPQVNLNDFRFLKDFPLITEYQRTGPFLVDFVMRLCKDKGLEPERIIKCNSYQSVMALVNANMGFTLMPLTIAKNCFNEKVDIYPLAGLDSINQNAICWHTPVLNEAINAFLNNIEALSPK